MYGIRAKRSGEIANQRLNNLCIFFIKSTVRIGFTGRMNFIVIYRK